MAVDGLRPWRDFFDDVTLARGLAYQRDGLVAACSGGGDGIITAAVEGRETYEVRIRLIAGEERREGLFLQDLADACGCPVGRRCKHVVAVLAEWSQQRGLPLVMPRVVPAPARGAGPPPAAASAGRDRDAGWKVEVTVGDAEDEDADGAAEATDDDPDGERTAGADPAELLPADLIDVNRNDTPALRALSEWLAWVHAQSAPTPAGTQQLGWILVALADGRSLAVETVLIGRRKTKPLGVLKRYHHGIDNLVRQPPAWVTAADIAVLESLFAAGGSYSGQVVLSGRLGSGLLLDRLVASGRAWWGEVAGPPLTAGPPVAAAPQWIGDSAGHRVALGAADGADWQVLLVDPPRYRRGYAVGAIGTALPTAALAAILRMPPLEAAVLATATPALARLLPELPPPAVPAPVRPEAWLAVVPVRVNDQWQWRWPKPEVDAEVALPWFRYPQGAVPPGGPALLRVEGEVVVRDLAAEQAALARLAGAGFAPLTQRPRLGYMPPPDGARLPPWLHVATADAANASQRNRPLTAFAVPATALALLAAAGWRIAGDAASAPLVIDGGDWIARVDGDDAGGGPRQDWFELHLGVQVGDERIELAPVLATLIAGGRPAIEALPRAFDQADRVLIALPDGRLLKVALEQVLRIHDHLIELFDAPPGPGGGLRVDAAQALLAAECDVLSPRWLGGERLRSLAERLRAASSPPAVALPAGLKAELRPYQRDGLAWLQHLRGLGLGGLLADDMGLGKTVQTIAHLVVEREAGRLDRPALVVCPASVVGTWARELARFAPGLRVLVLHGLERERALPALAGAHVLITSYGTLLRDRELLAALPLHLVVCDEAQALKNAAAKAGDAVRGLDSRHRLCLTGTPVENHLGELYALIAWLAPGLLGTSKTFERVFRKPIEKEGDRARQELLRRRLAPVVLRRTKEAVAKELPAKSESVIAVDLNPGQRALYESIRLAMDAEVRAAIAAKGLKRSQIEVLAALLKLRQVCCDPRLVPGKAGAKAGPSAKLEALADLLPNLIEDGRRVLLFSQFTAMLDRIEEDVVKPLGVPWLRLDGSTAKRQPLIDRFQAGEAPLFLLSLKAGGTGLTLTAADTVIHYDPWWNPAAEEQATDRAHRIGQDKPVLVYRLVCSGTVEERIQALQGRKRALAAGVYGDDGQAGGALSDDDIAALFAPLPG